MHHWISVLLIFIAVCAPNTLHSSALSIQNVSSIQKKIIKFISCSTISFCIANSYPTHSYSVDTNANSNSVPKLGECVTQTNPSATTITCRQLGLIDDNTRLRGCQANENCFSTSAKSASKYDSPWQFNYNNKQQLTSDEAWLVLKASVESEGLKVLKDKKVKDNYYMLAAERHVPKQPAGSSIFYEFLLRNDPEDKLILYRGVVDKTVFLYPLQQPVSDFGAIENKLNGIREKAGFIKVGN